jgi:hypothetical protein
MPLPLQPLLPPFLSKALLLLLPSPPLPMRAPACYTSAALLPLPLRLLSAFV